MQQEKFKVIYADPAWKQKAGRKMNPYKLMNGKQIWNSDHVKSENMPYDTMSVEDIKSLPVKNLAADDSVLFMWVTNTYLPQAFEIIASWGFTYSTTLVWAKNRMGGGLGGTFRITTEFLIYARRGSLPAKQIVDNTWFNVKRTYENGFPKNSKKPNFFSELIENTFDGPKLEMFARTERTGWSVWGNQVENSILI